MRTSCASICLATLTACAPSSHDVSQTELPPTTDVECGDFASQVADAGVVYNNVWNKAAAEGYSSEQCIIQEARQGGRLGWRWSWPREKRAVFGQPQIKIGASPWDPEPKFGTTLPMRVNAIRTLRVNHSLAIASEGDFNIVTTSWLGEGKQPGREAIRAEVMIWTYATPGQFPPAGQLRETTEIAGDTWDVWTDSEWKDVSGANENQWAYLAYRRKQNGFQADVDVAALLAHATTRGYISADWFVYDLELGMEVMGGEGRALIDAFEVYAE